MATQPHPCPTPSGAIESPPSLGTLNVTPLQFRKRGSAAGGDSDGFRPPPLKPSCAWPNPGHNAKLGGLRAGIIVRRRRALRGSGGALWFSITRQANAGLERVTKVTILLIDDGGKQTLV